MPKLKKHLLSNNEHVIILLSNFSVAQMYVCQSEDNDFFGRLLNDLLRCFAGKTDGSEEEDRLISTTAVGFLFGFSYDLLLDMLLHIK
jgi:hypothetical protein